MKKYRFRLQQVLNVRRIEEERARAYVLAAQADVHRISAEHDRRIHEHQSAMASPGAATRAAHMAERTMAELRALAIVSTRDELEAAAQRSSERMYEWAAAARRVQALERLDERRREEHRIEVQRDEDRLIDDLVTGRFARTHWGDES